jgi:hypothetical protein
MFILKTKIDNIKYVLISNINMYETHCLKKKAFGVFAIVY